MFAIKAAVADPKAGLFAFDEQKTMYRGKRIAEGDALFIFASENEGGADLVAMGIVTSASVLPRRPGIARLTPRVSIVVSLVALTRRRLGRAVLRPHSNRDD